MVSSKRIALSVIVSLMFFAVVAVAILIFAQMPQGYIETQKSYNYAYEFLSDVLKSIYAVATISASLTFVIFLITRPPVSVGLTAVLCAIISAVTTTSTYFLVALDSKNLVGPIQSLIVLAIVFFLCSFAALALLNEIQLIQAKTNTPVITRVTKNHSK